MPTYAGRKEAGSDDTTPHVIDLTDSPPTTPRHFTSTDQPQSGPPALMSAHNASIRQHTSAYVGGVAYAQAVPLDELDERTLVASGHRPVYEALRY
jgi:hypothetical protein